MKAALSGEELLKRRKIRKGIIPRRQTQTGRQLEKKKRNVTAGPTFPEKDQRYEMKDMSTLRETSHGKNLSREITFSKEERFEGKQREREKGEGPGGRRQD